MYVDVWQLVGLVYEFKYTQFIRVNDHSVVLKKKS